jgi:cardiolipin synthase (CMP-forming)
MTNLPTLLTWGRILAIPLLVGLQYAPWPRDRIDTLATMLFVAAAITDWFDGWLARRLGQTSAFGAFLDPVADKLIVAAALVFLVDLHRVDAVVATIIIGREIAISALREWMAIVGARTSVAVHWVGKLKTIAQLVAIPMLLFDAPLWGVIDVRRVGTVLIWVAAVLTVWSMFYYLKKALPYFRQTPPQGNES